MGKMRKSLGGIDLRLYLALLLLGFCPTVYTTLRIFFLGRLPDAWAYSIAGQLGWLNLVYEILNEAILLPLFHFMGQAAGDRAEFSNRVRSGLLATFCLFALLTAFVLAGARPMLLWMAADERLAEASAAYIRIESVANLFGMLGSYALVALVTLGKRSALFALTAARLVLSVALDTFLVSTLPFSLNLGVNGIGWSNILVNIILLAASVLMLEREGVGVFSGRRMEFGWMRPFLRVGGFSGLESFVRNIAYMLMIVRMVNVVGEQGVYWVANSFIWGWLLPPVTQLGELVKREVATDPGAIRTHTRGYFGITGAICLVWLATIPLWKPFMAHVLGYGEVERLFGLVLLLSGFYVLYAFQNIFDATFYGLGATHYMLLESVATNSVYYGGAFVLYAAGLWAPTLEGIALMFGLGVAFDSVVSFAAYLHLLRRRGIRLE